MSWNHRVIRRTFTHADESYEDTYAIYEVHYDKNGKVEGYTSEPVSPQGETIEELEEELKLFQAALTKPVLEYEEDTVE